MKILPIAFDSFGVRSQATFVETDRKIFIDPGIALAPSRYGLKPTKEEYKALEILKEKIIEIAKDCEILIVTHYHYDHHPYPEDEELYKVFDGKIVLAKDFSKDVNLSGKKRGKIFYEKIEGKAKEIIFADEKSFAAGNTKINFSKGVWHGEENSKVGKVLMLSIEHQNKKFLFGSDAQSLANKDALEFAVKENPDLAIIDGYPTIFIGYKMSLESFKKSKESMKEFLEKTKVKEIILDHHIVRDLQYKEKIKDVIEFASSLNKKILTAAEYYGLENFFLEALRKDIKEKKVKVDLEKYYKKLFEKIEEKL